MTFDHGTNDNNVQVLAINIWDDQLLEGTESFVVSGTVTAPASFVPGGDRVTVDILDSDGKLYTQSWCLNHSCRKLHASLKIPELFSNISSWCTQAYRRKKAICREKYISDVILATI